jgi:hypothetical protein
MKRLVSIGFIAFYFALSVGVNVLIHTCCGFKSIDVMPMSAKDPCGSDTECSDDMCCTLVLQTIGIADDQQAAPCYSPGSPDCATVVYPQADALVWAIERPAPSNIDPSPPPGISPTILNCVLLI